MKGKGCKGVGGKSNPNPTPTVKNTVVKKPQGKVGGSNPSSKFKVKPK